MTKATRGFLSYLKQYLAKSPGLRVDLCAYHQKVTGRQLYRHNLTRYLALENQPTMDTALVLMTWLQAQGELSPAAIGLFRYRHPEWLRKTPAEAPAKLAA